MAIGIVIKKQNGFYYVAPTAEIDATAFAAPLVTCKLRGKLFKQKVLVATGDRVEYTALPDGKGAIERIQPRKSFLLRPPVANIDQAVLVFAATDPAPHPKLIDRFFVMAEASHIARITLCFNKVDDEAVMANIAGYLTDYSALGYDVLAVSAQTGKNIAALRQRLADHISVFAGPSGVGKSSLANALNRDLALKTGELSEKINRGRHTTRLASLFPLGENSYIVDTPGFSVLDLAEMDEKDLPACFPEFRPYLGNRCYYNGCLHSHEPDCAVKDAVAAGEIAARRYESYLSILSEILERKKAKRW